MCKGGRVRGRTAAVGCTGEHHRAPDPDAFSALLGPADIRELAAALGVRPTKQRGQNFVIDANTVRRIVRTHAAYARTTWSWRWAPGSAR